MPRPNGLEETQLTQSTKSDRDRSLEEAVSYALNHRIRIEILCLLNEAAYTASDLAARTPWALPTISYHLKAMLRAGSIEVAKVGKVRNVEQNLYRAVELPIVDDDEAAELPPEVKQEYAAVILQAVMAECLDALRTRKLTKPLVRMMWRWFNLDDRGRQELASEQIESWERTMEIAARSANRQAASGERGKTVIAVTLGFERSTDVGSPGPTAHRLAPNES
jgi:DNA-binding transcriptional ArsR family regulator